MYDLARISRLRRGDENEPDRDGARYLINELESAIIRGARDPAGSQGTRYRNLIVALEATTDRLGIRFRPEHDSLGSLARAHPGLGSMPTMLRSAVVRGPFEALLEALDEPQARKLFEPIDQPTTGWAALDDEIAQLRRDAAGMASGLDRGAIGRLCREIFVSLADAAYDEKRHGPLPEPKEGAGGGSVKTRIEAVIATEAVGSNLALLRSVSNKCLDLANRLQHRKNPSDAESMICADATIFVVTAVRRLIAAGRSEP